MSFIHVGCLIGIGIAFQRCAALSVCLVLSVKLLLVFALLDEVLFHSLLLLVLFALRRIAGELPALLHFGL